MSDKLFRKKAPKIMGDLIRDFDLSVEDAAAILGNIGGETGGFSLMQEVKPLVKGSRGGYGWCQWTGPRRRAYEAWCKKNKLDPASDPANYGFLCVELRTTEKKAIPALWKAKSLPDKVIAFERTFERAGIPHHSSRIRWAEKALEAFRAAAPAPEPAEPEPAPSPPPPDVEPIEAPEPAPEKKSMIRRVVEWFAGIGGLGGLGFATLDWKAVVAFGAVAIAGVLVWHFIIKPRRRK